MRSGKSPTRISAIVACVAALLLADVTFAPPAGAGNVKPPKPVNPRNADAYFPLTDYPPDAVRDNVVLKWNAQTLAAIRRFPLPPTAAARALAMAHTAMYNAWTAFDTRARPTISTGWNRQTGLPAAEVQAAKSMAISYAAEKTLASLFGGMAGEFRDFRVALGYTAAPSGQNNDPAEIGVRAANAVIASRSNDNSNQANSYADTSGYQPGTTTTVDISLCWVPLPGQTFSTPHWRTVTPFALTSASQFRPDGPRIKKGGTPYKNEIKELVKIARKLDDNARARALFWWDGAGTETPPGHYHVFAQVASRKRGNSLDTDVKLFFALGNSGLDAGIAAWDAKRHWDFQRPITAIRREYAGQRIESWDGVVDGAQWRSYLGTPPHPDYLSGHATFSSAAAHVLSTMIGDDFGARVTIPAGTTVTGSGSGPTADVTIALTRFSQMATDSGNSRMWGGIHFIDANLHGIETGRQVGRVVLAKAASYWS